MCPPRYPGNSWDGEASEEEGLKLGEMLGQFSHDVKDQMNIEEIRAWLASCGAPEVCETLPPPSIHTTAAVSREHLPIYEGGIDAI